MSINLQKGQKISLSKDNAGLSKVTVGLGWDEVQQKKGGILGGLFSAKGANIDCDASAIVLTNDRLAVAKDIVYYGNLVHSSGTVKHMGDNLTGAGDGDDEQIVIDLAALPAQYNKVVVVANIYQAVQRNQHFGMIQNAFIRIVDNRTGAELCKFSLSDNYSGKTALVFGELYRHNGEWKFNAVGEGTNDPTIQKLAERVSR